MAKAVGTRIRKLQPSLRLPSCQFLPQLAGVAFPNLVMFQTPLIFLSCKLLQLMVKRRQFSIHALNLLLLRLLDLLSLLTHLCRFRFQFLTFPPLLFLLFYKVRQQSLHLAHLFFRFLSCGDGTFLRFLKSKDLLLCTLL